MRISDQVAAQSERITSLRRSLHRIPEIGHAEFETSDYLWNFLMELRPDVLERVCGTGIKCVFGLDLPGPAVAIRADMDALPVAEKTGRPFASCRDGFMHACGHDGHMAVALITALIVAENRLRLTRPFVVIFQPAEETTGGALSMIEKGVLRNPDIGSIYGIHLWPYIPEGRIGLHAGPLMAAMSDLDIRIEGKNCHGASPQDGADALVAACHFVTAVQSVIARNVDPFEAAVVSFGRMSGGESRNVVCGSVDIEGTVRSFIQENHSLIRARIEELLKGLQRMFRVRSCCSEPVYYPAVNNPADLTDAAQRVIDPDEWTDVQPVMMSEDFAFYQQYVPGLFAFVGSGSQKYHSPLHSAQFDFDESVLLSGVEFFLRVTGVS